MRDCNVRKMNLKLLASLVLVIGMLFTASFSVFAATIPNGDARVTSANVNMRKSGTTSADVVGIIPKGTFVTIYANNNKGWYKVKYNSKYGYVKGDYLANPFNVYGDKYSKVMLTDIQMRKTPTQSSDNKICIIRYNKKVFLMSKVKNANWYKVWYNGKVGYVIGGYFRGDTTYVRTVAKACYLRSTPKVSTSNRIKLLHKTYKVVLLSKYNTKWYKARYGAYTGYIDSTCLKGTTGGTTPSTGTTKVVSANLNMRSSREINSTNIICVIPEGSSVKVTATYSDNWYGITYNNKTGYVKGGYFK